jgi:hypothetical protein
MKQLPNLSEFPISHVVAYNYYLGRLMVFEEQYQNAENCLMFALIHCQKSSIYNKRRILQFLIPVKLLHSKFPHTKLLQVIENKKIKYKYLQHLL